MFSVDYVVQALYLSLKYPSMFSRLLQGEKPSEVVYSKRMQEWLRVRNHYRDNAKRIFGLNIFLNPDDMSVVSSSIATTGWLELPRSELMRKFLKPGMTVVDVGANIGYYTLLSAKIIGKSGLVLAFEPDPTNFGFLCKSININNLSNVKAYQKVLSEGEGTMSLYLAEPSNPEAHSITQQHSVGKINVPSTTLDALYDSLQGRRIDLVKMHVGAEPMILRGGKRTLAEQKPAILMAFIPKLWKDETYLLDSLYDQYEVYEVVRTPFLRKRIEKTSLFLRGHTELFLESPRRSSVCG